MVRTAFRPGFQNPDEFGQTVFLSLPPPTLSARKTVLFTRLGNGSQNTPDSAHTQVDSQSGMGTNLNVANSHVHGSYNYKDSVQSMNFNIAYKLAYSISHVCTTVQVFIKGAATCLSSIYTIAEV